MAIIDTIKEIQALYIKENDFTPILIGERQVTFNHQSNRIVFVPIGGTFGPARNPGRNPRPLRTWLATCDVHVFGFDNTADGYTSDQREIFHYYQCEALFNNICRAIYLICHGEFDLSSPRWTLNPTELKFGKELVFTWEIQVPILDKVITTVNPPMISNLTNYMEFPDQEVVGCSDQ